LDRSAGFCAVRADHVEIEVAKYFDEEVCESNAESV
jgi:hypothetical protein